MSIIKIKNFHPFYSKPKHNKFEGFTLIEVLVALVIVSIGMLGIANLHVYSLQAGRTSILRHNAVTLAGDIAERIRANPNAGNTYTQTGINNNCVGDQAYCNSQQMASHDIYLWTQQATETLPNGFVSIEFGDNGITSSYKITLTWSEPGEVLNYTITIPVISI